MEIVHNPQRYEIVATVDGERIGELQYRLMDSGDMYANHTWTAEQHRGQGVGTKMLDQLAAVARQKHAKIIPICPFVAEMFDLYPEKYADVAYVPV